MGKDQAEESLAQYVNKMIKDVKSAHRNREDQLSQAAQSYKHRLERMCDARFSLMEDSRSHNSWEQGGWERGVDLSMNINMYFDTAMRLHCNLGYVFWFYLVRYCMNIVCFITNHYWASERQCLK